MEVKVKEEDWTGKRENGGDGSSYSAQEVKEEKKVKEEGQEEEKVKEETEEPEGGRKKRRKSRWALAPTRKRQKTRFGGVLLSSKSLFPLLFLILILILASPLLLTAHAATIPPNLTPSQERLYVLWAHLEGLNARMSDFPADLERVKADSHW